MPLILALCCREIFANLNYDDMPSLSPMPECLCPDNFPRALDGGIDLDLYCTGNVQHDNDDVKLARHVHSDTERLFLSEYLTDGILENSEIYENVSTIKTSTFDDRLMDTKTYAEDLMIERFIHIIFSISLRIVLRHFSYFLFPL